MSLRSEYGQNGEIIDWCFATWLTDACVIAVYKHAKYKIHDLDFVVGKGFCRILLVRARFFMPIIANTVKTQQIGNKPRFDVGKRDARAQVMC